MYKGNVGSSKIQLKDSENERLKDNSVAIRAAFGQDSGDVRYAVDYTRFGQLKEALDYKGERELPGYTGLVTDIGVDEAKFDTQSLGVSLYRDFNMNSAVVPYVGARVGVNRSKLQYDHKTTTTGIKDGAPVVEVVEETEKSRSSTAVGAGVQVGMQYHINPQIAVDLGLEYNHLGNFKFKESDGEKFKVKSNQAGVNVGVRYNF